MNMGSKYGLNQQVYLIRNERVHKFIPCEACGGTGKITLSEKQYTCPECYGRCGKTEWLPTQWQVIRPLTIGRVGIKVTSIKSTGIFDNIGEYDPANTKREETYMAYETGVGSGSVYYVEDICETKEEATAECERRNAEEAKQ